MAPVLILQIASSNFECAYCWDFMDSASRKTILIENLICWMKIERPILDAFELHAISFSQYYLIVAVLISNRIFLTPLIRHVMKKDELNFSFDLYCFYTMSRMLFTKYNSVSSFLYPQNLPCCCCYMKRSRRNCACALVFD